MWTVKLLKLDEGRSLLNSKTVRAKPSLQNFTAKQFQNDKDNTLRYENTRHEENTCHRDKLPS